MSLARRRGAWFGPGGLDAGAGVGVNGPSDFWYFSSER